MKWVLLIFLLLLPTTAHADMGQARRNYQRIWKQDRKYLGGGKAPPMMFSKKGEGYTTTGTTDRTDVPTPGQPRAIQLGPTARRALKHYDPKGGKDPSGIRYAVEHEFGRYFGPDQPLASGSGGNAGAGLANAVANRLTRARNKGKNPKPYMRKHLPYLGQQQIKWPSS